MDNTAILDTNLNQFPYWDDYDRTKQYMRWLFKPGTAIQTRELNALQENIFNQFYRLGQNLFVSGTIIEGCNITTNKSIPYVKLIDTYANGAPLTVTSLVGYDLYSANTGLHAKVFYAIPGSIVNSPNLNTINVQYFNSIANASTNVSIKTFQNDEIINVVNAANAIVGQIKLANTISSGSSNTTGYSYYVTVDDGVIFQKGMQLEVANQSICVTTYNNQPNGLSVGFTSIESVVTAYEDTSLLDNSQGSPNYAAPGADRLKVTPTLAVISTNGASLLGQEFFSIIDFINGSPSIVNQDTVYSVIGKAMSTISNDTNGSFVINPFNIKTKELQYSNNYIDPNYIRLEIDGGTGYVQGSKLNIAGQVISVLPKAYTYSTACNQIMTAQYGNYIIVDEYVGSFNPSIIEKVYLCNSAGYAVSNNLAKGIAPNSLTAPGTVIGTAYVLYFGNVTGNTNISASTEYVAFLFGVSMNGANSFNSVRSIFSNTSNVVGLADIVLQSNSAVLQESNTAALIFPFNQNAIKTVKNSSNAIDLQFEYQYTQSLTFTNNGITTFSVPTVAGGNNIFPVGPGQLSGITQIVDNFNLVAESTANTVNIAGSVATTSGWSNLTGTSTSFTTALVPGSVITLANSTVTETKLVNNIVNNTFLTVDYPFADTWSSANLFITYPTGTPIPLLAIGANVFLSNATSATITLPQPLTSTMSTQLVYNVLRTNAQPAKKDYQTLTYVVINCGNHSANIVGPYSLGVPDVLSISNVWLGTTASNTNPSVVNNFTLLTNQGDVSYNLSVIQPNKLSLNANSVLLVEFQCFKPDFSTGIGYYSVDSYPVDDTGVTANSIYTYEIPAYFSVAGQENFILRNCLDFRFYATNTIPYVTNVTGGMSNTHIINPPNTLSYPNSNNYVITPDTNIQGSIQYYLGRYDKIGISNAGIIQVNLGVPSENPIPPSDISTGMQLGTLYVPPYPSLTPDLGILTYPSVSVTYNTNKRYTMADVGNIDKRVTQLEYYTALSVLEQSAQNMQLNNSSGATIFQNGILVDPFANFSIANCSDPNFNIAIDTQNNICRPTFSQFPINLTYAAATSDNILQSGNERLYFLSCAQLYPPFISQPFASHERNCAQDTLYVWSGTVVLTPDGCYQPDVTTDPTVTVSTSDLSNWQQLANAWGTQWGTWEETNNQVTNTVTSNTTTTSGATVTTQTTTQSTATTSTSIGTQISVGACTQTSSFGDVVTSLGLQPFIPATAVSFSAYGLKPDTQHWPFFNDTPVSQYCLAPTDSFTVFGRARLGAPLISDNTGALFGEFLIPPDTFSSAIVNFQLLDISNLVTQNDVITSIASANFFGTNIAYTQNELDLQTTSAQLSYNYVSDTVVNVSNISFTNTIIVATKNVYITNTVTKVVNNVIYKTKDVYVTVPTTPSKNVASACTIIATPVYNGTRGTLAAGEPFSGTDPNAALLSQWQYDGSPGISPPSYAYTHDPVAQSFTVVNSQLPIGTQAVLATSIDLFFASTDTTLGITFQIQPVSNGTIQNEIVPFSQYHLMPGDIVTSTTATAVTNILFQEPIVLQTGQQYAFVLIPDGANPNYDIWTAVIGGTDVTTGASIFSLSSTGIMFISSQGTSWTPYQNEEVKFNLYVAGMLTSNGTATFVNENNEYLQYNTSPTGIFMLSEQVYLSNINLGNSSVVTGNVLVSGLPNTGLALGWTNGLANQIIGLISPINQQSFTSTVNSVVNSTAITLSGTIPFTDANVMVFVAHPVTGIISTVNSTFMTLGNSTANVSIYLGSNIGYILGSNSSAYVGNVTLVDIPFDSVMPKLSTSTPSGTSLTYDFLGTSNNSTGYVQDIIHNPLNYGKTTQLLDHERVIMSMSNEMKYNSGAKSYTMYSYFLTNNGYESPIIDDIKLGAWTVYNLINGDDANSDIFYSEINNAGQAIDRYISTTVTLAPGNEAENLSVFVGAYYPPNSGIYVYCKLLNQYDPDNFTLKSWTPMICNNSYRGSLTNILDYNDYGFNLPTVNAAPYTAALSPSNNYIVSYTSPSGGVYAEYNTFAIKIVLTSNNSAIVPRLTNFRAVSSQSVA